jgi:hypothetical protein
MTRDDIHDHCRKHKYSYEFEVYWAAHRVCEVQDCHLYSAAPRHIRSRGAGGDDESVNLLALCSTHHFEVENEGCWTFSDKHPELAAKIRAAKDRRRQTA